MFDPPPEAAVTPGRRWLGHRVSRNLACRILGLTELGIEDDTETEGNRAIFRRRRSWLFRRTVPGREVEVNVGGTTLKAVCDYAGHFHVSGEVQEHELSNFAGLGVKEQEEERLSTSPSGLEDVSRMTRSASFSAALSELDPEESTAQVQLPLPVEEHSAAEHVRESEPELEPEPEPDIEPVPTIISAPAGTPVSSPVRAARSLQNALWPTHAPVTFKY